MTTNETENSSVMDALHHSQNLVRESLQQTYHIDGQTADRYFRDMWLVENNYDHDAIFRGLVEKTL